MTDLIPAPLWELPWYAGALRRSSGDWSSRFTLEETPARCPITPEDAHLRHLLYGKKPHVYRVIFELDERRKMVKVLTIRHGARQAFKADELDVMKPPASDHGYTDDATPDRQSDLPLPAQDNRSRPRTAGFTKAGDIIRPLRKKAARVPEPASKTLTPVKKRLLEASAGIRESIRKEDVSYLASQLVQVTLPHSDPGDVPHWSRTNGNLTLSIIRSKVDSETGNLVGYPYGTIPRLLLYWITSEATRTKSRVLTLGRSLAEFMEEVGLNSSSRSGERSDAKTAA